MIPHLMNCSHIGDGWCLDCAGAIHQKLTLECEHSAWLQGECNKIVDDLYHRNGVHRKFRAEVAVALAELRDKVQVALTAETLDLLTLRQEIMIDGIDAVIAKLDLPHERQM